MAATKTQKRNVRKKEPVFPRAAFKKFLEKERD